MAKQSDAQILREAKDRFRKCQDWESVTRNHFLSDMRFGNGDSFNMYQWSEQIANSRLRSDKPCLTVNRTRQYCLQIVNNARQNKPQIEIRAVGNGASYKSAEIYEGVVRHIEYVSNAQQAYDSATWGQVFGGIGYWRVTTDYAHDDSFDQEIFIKRIANPLSVFLDPHIQEYDGSDARYGFIFSDMDLEEFKAAYPKYADFYGLSPLGELSFDNQNWVGKDRIRISEYYRIVHTDDVLHYLDNGDTVRESEVKDAGLLEQLKINSTNTREISAPKVEWFLIAGNEIAEKRDWLGSTIPIVRCVGEETVIDGVLDRRGHVRALLDAQKSYNYFCSAGIEYVALQSKTPWVAPVAAIEGYESEWAQANNTNLSVLPYNHLGDDGKEIPAPAREQPPAYAPAYVQGMQIAQNDMQMASGQYEAVMGEPSNERSGSALRERQRSGLNSTYHFIDHLASAIRYTGRILVDLIPKVYDTNRVLKIMAVDGTPNTVQLDPNAPQAHQEVQNLDSESIDPQHIAQIFNPKVGDYDVIADIGPAYETRRQEAFNALSDILAQNESLAPIVGDLLFRSADFPLSSEIAERMKNMVPEKALGKGPSPELQQAQQQLAMQHQVMQKMGSELEAAKSKANSEQLEKELGWYKAETERLAAVGKIDPVALMPVVRQLVSEVLGVPVNQVIAHHMAENAQMLAATQQHPQQLQQSEPSPQGEPPA